MKLNELPRLGLGVNSYYAEDENDNWFTVVKLYNPTTDSPIDNYTNVRFVEATTKEGLVYVFAAARLGFSEPPKWESLGTHSQVGENLDALLMDSDEQLQVVGGGFLSIVGGRLSLFDRSDRFGKFNVANVEPVVRQYVKDNMPHIKEVEVI